MAAGGGPFECHRAARTTRHIFKARPPAGKRFAQFGESATGGGPFRGLICFGWHVLLRQKLGSRLPVM
jgi:hypothetical protein